jgi:hypothetical protein
MKPKPSLTNIEPLAVRKLAEKLWTIGYRAKCKSEQVPPRIKWEGIYEHNRVAMYAVARHLLKRK